MTTNPYKSSTLGSDQFGNSASTLSHMIAVIVVFLLASIAMFFVGNVSHSQAYGTIIPSVYFAIAFVANFALHVVRPESFAGFWVCSLVSCVTWGAIIASLFHRMGRHKRRRSIRR